MSRSAAGAAGLCLALNLLGPAAWALDLKQGRLGHLAPLIGTYRHQEILADPAVQDTLAALVPAEAMPALLRNLDVVGPVDFISGHLVFAGNRAHHGGEDEAMVWIRIHDGSIRVALKQQGLTAVYARERQYGDLPLAMRIYLSVADNLALWEPPPGVALAD